MEYFSQSFQELSNSDLYDIMKARVDVFVDEQKIVCQELDGLDKDCIHYFIKDGGKLVAYARSYWIDDHTVRIGRVLTTVRGKGFGKAVMEYAISTIANDSKVRVLVVDAQLYAIGFYEKLGFEVVSDEFMEDGILHVRMERHINGIS